MIEKLDMHGTVAIRREIETVGAGYEGVVLLCYERVPGPEWCHRTMVAKWLSIRLGWDVTELVDETPWPKPPKPKPDPDGLSLF